MRTVCGRCAETLRCKRVERFGGEIYLCHACQRHFFKAQNNYKMRMILFNACKIDEKKFKNAKAPCYYCKNLIGWNESTVDHVQPKCMLPLRAKPESLWNTVLCCRPCNEIKDDVGHNEFIQSEYLIKKRIDNGSEKHIYLL